MSYAILYTCWPSRKSFELSLQRSSVARASAERDFNELLSDMPCFTPLFGGADDRPASERSETTQKSEFMTRIHRMLGLINLVG